MRMVIVTWILALALMACVACDLAGPETVPVDPGTVVAHVSDRSGAPLRDVWVYVHGIPNGAGTTFSVGVPTNASGTARIDAIPAGRRRVEVKPPPGYAAPDAASFEVDVVKGQIVAITLTLEKTPA